MSRRVGSGEERNAHRPGRPLFSLRSVTDVYDVGRPLQDQARTVISSNLGFGWLEEAKSCEMKCQDI